MKFDPKKHLPKTGPSGSTVVACSVERESADEMHHIMKPLRPDRDVYDYDDDGPFFVRTMTTKEYATAMASYEKATEEWYRTGGLLIAKGPTRTTVRIECKDGSTAEGVWTDDGWHWTNETWRSPAVAR